MTFEGRWLLNTDQCGIKMIFVIAKILTFQAGGYLKEVTASKVWLYIMDVSKFNRIPGCYNQHCIVT